MSCFISMQVELSWIAKMTTAMRMRMMINMLLMMMRVFDIAFC